MAGRRSRSRFLLAALAVAAIVVAGCGSTAGKVTAVALLKEGAAAAEASSSAAARANLTPAVRTITARSSPVIAGRTQATVVVRSQRAAATSIAKSPPARAAAETSAAKVETLAVDTATESTGRARIRACAKSGATNAAQAYARAAAAMSSEGQPPPNLEAILTEAIGGCLGDAFPNQPAAVGRLTKALVNTIGQSTQQVSQAEGVGAQTYTDWLVYTASLYTQAASTQTEPGATAIAAGAAPARSPHEQSVDALLIVLSHAHAGRVAVANGDWDTAIANRRFVLGELRALRVVPALEHARGVLVEAMAASLAADRSHAACGPCPTAYDEAATRAKQAFVAEYDPYVVAMYGRGLDATQI
jgi:hypothetical protein